MTKINDLTEGSIFKALVKLALPIMGTSFVQMAYNLTDMLWIGRVGSKAVAAVGTARYLILHGYNSRSFISNFLSIPFHVTYSIICLILNCLSLRVSSLKFSKNKFTLFSRIV